MYTPTFSVAHEQTNFDPPPISVATKRIPSFTNDFNRGKKQHSRDTHLVVTEKNKKSCTFCLNTALLPNHTRPTCPKLIKYGCAPIADESLVAFEQKSKDFLVVRIPFNANMQ